MEENQKKIEEQQRKMVGYLSIIRFVLYIKETVFFVYTLVETFKCLSVIPSCRPKRDSK